jgi:hypothetical protein
MGLHLLQRRPREEQTPDQFLLVGLVVLVGFGSFAFHLLATEGTELLDVVPIFVFMLVYLGYALNRFLGVPPGFMVLLVIGFTAIMGLTMQVKCWDGGVGIPGPEVQGVKPCLNGSIFYLPALAALIVVGLLLEERRHRAAPYVLWAAAIFAVSLTLRSLDMALCDKILIEGRKVGTHFVWHLLNALALFLLLRASLEGGPAAAGGASLTPASDEAATTRKETRAEPAAAKPLTERVASATEEAARKDEPPKADEKPKVFFPA